MEQAMTENMRQGRYQAMWVAHDGERLAYIRVDEEAMGGVAIDVAMDINGVKVWVPVVNEHEPEPEMSLETVRALVGRATEKLSGLENVTVVGVKGEG